MVVELDAWAADDVRGRRWHPSQELTELPRGMLRVRLRLNNLEEVERWVLSLGTHATVVRPEKLRERLRKATEELGSGTGSRRSPRITRKDAKRKRPDVRRRVSTEAKKDQGGLRRPP